MMRRTTVLLADDFAPWRSMVCSQLKTNSDFKVIAEASNGCEAIEKAGQLHPDVVLLDVGMPLLNGLEAAPRIRQVSPGSKIVFLTQLQDDDIRTAAFAMGADGYVLKSNMAGRLISAIQAALDGRQAMHTTLSPSLVFG